MARKRKGDAQKAMIKISISMLFLLSLCMPNHSSAGGWLLMVPEFTITDTEIIPSKKWVGLESFATVLQCNDHRSFSIRQIDQARRELKDAREQNTAIETDRELRVLWYVYTNSKCVSSR